MNIFDQAVSAVASDFAEGPTVNPQYQQADFAKQQKEVATGVTSPSVHATVYISIIEELETENRMLRARNERLTMAMKKIERLLQENLR